MSNVLNRPYQEAGDYVAAGELLVRDKLSGDGVAMVMVNGNPNGVQPGPVGQLAIDVTTGICYQNVDDAMGWERFIVRPPGNAEHVWRGDGTWGYAPSLSQGAALLSDVATAGTRETVFVSFVVPANTFRVGDVYAFRGAISRVGTDASTGLTLRVRVGPTTLTGVEVLNCPGILTSVAGGSGYHGQLVIRGIGTAGTGRAEGMATYIQNGAPASTGWSTAWRQPPTAINTTVDNLVEITGQNTGGNTYTARSLSIARILRGP